MSAFLRLDRTFRKRMFLLCLLGAIGAGCAGPKSEPLSSGAGGKAIPAVDPSLPPEEILYEQLSSGSFQMNAAAGSIEETLRSAQASKKKLRRETAEAFQDVIDFVDSAGSSVAEYTDEPPTKEAVAKDFTLYDEKRLKAIEAGNDALRDLREALGVLESLAEGGSGTVVQEAEAVRSLLAVAIGDLWGAIEALGGKPVAEEDEAAG